MNAEQEAAYRKLLTTGDWPGAYNVLEMVADLLKEVDYLRAELHKSDEAIRDHYCGHCPGCEFDHGT